MALSPRWCATPVRCSPECAHQRCAWLALLAIGAPVLDVHYDKVIAAFSALTGSIIGFYFAARTATTPPDGATNASTKAAGDSATEHTQ